MAEGGSPASSVWKIQCQISRSPDQQVDVGNLINSFEWKAMDNSGYIIRADVEDSYFNILDKIIEKGDDGFLKSGRDYDKPTLVKFKMEWATPDGNLKTKECIALVADVVASGDSSMSGNFEFIAVDPISFYVNSGDCSGKAYSGKIGGKDGVIYQVLKDYLPDSIGGYKVKYEVSDTDDDEENTYWMMRQDPKTFIMSLLEWSSSLTEHKTSWSVTSGFNADDGELLIKIEEGYNPDLGHPMEVENDSGPLVLIYGGSGTTNVESWDMMANSFLSALNTKLLTGGISAVSGEYFDKITDEKEKTVYVKDENTENKINPKLRDTQSFTKPTKDDKGWTYISSIPEVYSDGGIGLDYGKYISGRARQQYLDMLSLLMRIKIRVVGQPRLSDTSELGDAKVKVKWMKTGDDGGAEPRFLDGDWLICGWHHHARRNRSWVTDVYLARLDYNAEAKPGGG